MREDTSAAPQPALRATPPMPPPPSKSRPRPKGATLLAIAETMRCGTRRLVGCCLFFFSYSLLFFPLCPGI
ncbi:hypothetical protein VTK56DRAFT_6223 [Thermocarpiscus australiensis]